MGRPTGGSSGATPRWLRQIAGAVALMLVVEGTAALTATASVAASGGKGTSGTSTQAKQVAEALTALDVPSAIATARLRKARVEVLGEAAEQSRTWANPNGTLTTESYALPIRFKRDGQWVDVDTTLKAGSDGSVAPRGHAKGLKLAGGGKDAILAVQGNGVHQVSVGWKGNLPKPSLKGDTATYADVTPGTDVTVQATRSGFEQNVVLRSRPAAGYQVTIPISAKGLKAKQDKNGSITFTDSEGRAAGSIPAPYMWDAAVDAKSLEHKHQAPVAMTMKQSGDTVNLTLTPDAKFLADPATKYPVTVDPSVSLSSVIDTFAQISYSTPQYTNTELKLGTYNGGADVARSFLQFPMQQLINTKILSSSLNLYENWSSNCLQTSWELWQTGAADISTVWTNQPTWTTKYASTTQTKGYPSSCGGSIPAGWVSIDPSAFLQYAGDHGYNYANIGLRATNEADSNSWKRFNSANAASNVPYLSVTYNSYPMSSAPTAAPGVTSGTKLYSNTTTPQLQATVADADGGNVMARWNVYDTTGGGNTQIIANLNGSWTASGGLSSAQVPAGKLIDGHTYTAWPWGYDGSLWSRQTVPNGLVFTVDSTNPGSPTVTSADYPADGWGKGAGQAGNFTITPPSGGSDTSGVVWQLDAGTQSFAATTGSAVTVSAAPPWDGPHALIVSTRDLAGNLSASTTYHFNAGAGAVTSPSPGDRTDRRVTLTAAGPTTTQNVKFQYRRSDSDAWTDVPVGKVVKDGNPLSGWPVTMTNGSSPALVWDVAGTLGDDGSVQLRGEFTDSASVVFDSSPVTFTLDRKESRAVSSKIGPGSLNLSTGDYVLLGEDGGAFGLAVNRTASSRNPAGGAPIGQVAPFGPQWSLGGTTDATVDYTEIRPVTASAVQLVMTGSGEVSFTKESDGTWAPEPGSEAYQLSYNGSTDQFTLVDLSGTTSVFAKSAASAGVWTLRSTTPTGGQGTLFRFDSVTSGSTTLVRPSRVAAPTSALSDINSSCLTPSTPAAGCRVLEYGYANTTTAGASFGDFAGQVNQVSLWLTDPQTGIETATVIARYAYDSTGMLRQVWDPRVSPNLVTAYSYDAAGRVGSVTPPGELPWNFTYGTAGSSGDTNAGRLLNVSRATLLPGSNSITNGTAATTVVYDVPLSTGAGGPYAMGSSDVGAWAQTDVPTDATAVFPADQVPSSNTGSGLTSGSYGRASVHYLNVDGREVNLAVPGGHITTAEYDTTGNLVRELGAGNRELALADSTNAELNALGLASLTTAQRAVQLSNQHVFDSSGQRETDTYGPIHRITLEHDVAASGSSGALGAGAVVSGRAHTHNTFDEGRPTDGSATVSNQITRAVTGVAITGYASDADTRTTTTAYDWALGKPVQVVIDPSGLAITSVTAYNGSGQVVSASQPASNGTDAGTTLSTYYSAAGAAPCGGHPEWADLLCTTAPAGAITGGGSNPTQRVSTTITYTRDGLPAVVTETANGVTRTTTNSYDAGDRLVTSAVTGGVGQTTQTPTSTYDTTNGRITQSSTPDGATVRQSYDLLGRITSYSDASGNTAATRYDSLDRITQVTDSAPTTITYTYDTSKDPRGLLTSKTDSHVGTFTGVYDADGILVTETLPGSVNLTIATDETGKTLSRTYTDGSGNVLVSDQASFSGHGSEVTRSLSTSGGLGLNDNYTYDQGARLASAAETVISAAVGTCTVRRYSFDRNSNRTSLTTASGSTGAACPTAGGTTATHSYDSADRLVDAGYAYDAFGRTTVEPDTTATSYYTTDLVYQQTKGNSRTTWQLDPAGRIKSALGESNTSGTWAQTSSRVSHYNRMGDSPSWTVEDTGTSAYTSNVTDLESALSATFSSATGAIALQLTNLHGDVSMILPLGSGSVTFSLTDEFGNRIAGTQAVRYGWRGESMRSGETPSGDLLMGARLYSPSTGRFLQTDPISGGSASAYDYANADPLNQYDDAGLSGTTLGGRMTTVEARWCGWPSRWRICQSMYGDAYVAAHVAVNIFGSTDHRSYGDAFQHVFWMALVTLHEGPNSARGVGQRHEDYSSNKEKDRQMANWNNETGIWIGLDAKRRGLRGRAAEQYVFRTAAYWTCAGAVWLQQYDRSQWYRGCW
ncbi:RHS repeat-associated core domain-containing protein [Kitasatospora sp. NPDC051914]|uniref:RHS repeat-associated core domain-containing protein n=1 Tax=Kitasatospora sp. NPDC051914 TaxID=3154945 RepID=UPI003427A132